MGMKTINEDNYTFRRTIGKLESSNGCKIEAEVTGRDGSIVCQSEKLCTRPFVY